MITPRTLLCIIFIILTGCLVQPSNPSDVAAYNNQVIALITPFITPVVGFLSVVALWIKSNIDKKDIKQEAKAAAMEVAAESKKVAETLAEKTEIAKDKVLNKIEETHIAAVSAIDKTNNTNEKILQLQEQVVTRRPSRATDTPDSHS